MRTAERISGISVALGSTLVAFHVGREVGGYDAPREVPYALYAALVVGVLSYARSLPRGDPRDWTSNGVQWTVLVGGTAAALDVFETFAIAVTVLPLLLLFIHTARARGVVKYDSETPRFVVSRSAAYGLVRCTGALLVRHTALPAKVALLLPLAVSLAETGAMVVCRSRAYAFAVDSVDFAVYAVLKSALFLALPLLEEALLHR